jgi:hypothetical protein
MKVWIFVCSCLVVAGLLLQIGAPPPAVAAGLVIGGGMIWWRNRQATVNR